MQYNYEAGRSEAWADALTCSRECFIAKEVTVMRRAKIIRLICDIGIIIFLLGFLLAFFWYGRGSFEMAPTEEQQEKARIGAALLMALAGALCTVGIAVRRKLGRSCKADDGE